MHSEIYVINGQKSSRIFFARIWIAPILNQSAKGATVCEGRLEIGGTEDEQTSDHTRNNI